MAMGFDEAREKLKAELPAGTHVSLFYLKQFVGAVGECGHSSFSTHIGVMSGGIARDHFPVDGDFGPAVSAALAAAKGESEADSGKGG